MKRKFHKTKNVTISIIYLAYGTAIL